MKKLLLVCFSLLIVLSVGAQDRVITGRVTSSDDGSPLPGVNVVVKGTANGTVTDSDGRYTLAVTPSDAILIFSFIGMQTYEEAIGARSIIDLPMQADVKQLGEVVITALGIKEDRDKFASSVSSVQGNNIARSGETGMLQGLTGKAAGVLITRTGGDPGAGAYIQIRGQNTINGNAQPLFIIDGVPMSNSEAGNGLVPLPTGGVQNLAGAGNAINNQSRSNDINPEDIASMEILKGASAAALWGTRAANGVIIITTKKGSDTKGRVNISLKTTVSLDEVNKMHKLQRNYGGGSDGKYRQGNRESWGDKIADRTGGPDAFITDPSDPLYNGFVTFPDGTRRYAIAPGTGPTSFSGTGAGVHGGKNSKDTWDHRYDAYQTGYFLDNNLQISGGNANSNFMISYSNLDQTGVVKSFSDYNRNTARVNVSHQFTEWFRASANVGYINSFSTRYQSGDNLDGLLLGGLRSSPDFDNNYYIGDYTTVDGLILPNRHVSYRNPLGKNFNPSYSNPIWNINNTTNTSDVDRIVGNLELGIDPTSWLNITGRVGIDNYTDQLDERFPQKSATFQDGFYQKNVSGEKQLNMDLFGRASRTFNQNFTGVFLLGVNYNNRIQTLEHTQLAGFIVPEAPPTLQNGLNANLQAYNNKNHIRTFAYYAQADLQAYDMLFLSLTGRQESASTFANSFFFPSAALAWQFSKLNTLSASSLLSFGKLRVSWGQVGIQPQPYLNLTTFNQSFYNDDYASGLRSSSSLYGGGYTRNSILGNPNLKPETKTETEVGTDLRFFNDRLTFSATGYVNQTKDVILNLGLPNPTGYVIQPTNAAKLENKGIELEVGFDVLPRRAFTWNISGNLGLNRNKVVSLAGSAAQTLPNSYGGQSLIEGQPFGVMFETDFLRDEKGTLLLDANGFPQGGSESQIIGNPNPKYRAGIGNTFGFKGISLYVLFDRVYGNDFYNGTRGALYVFGTHEDTGYSQIAPTDLKTYDGATIPAGTEFRGQIKDFGAGPVALTQEWYKGPGSSFSPASTKQFVEDATATRLREVTLTYSLRSAGFRNATKLTSVDFSITGRNLILWTNYTGIDPEVSVTGASLARGNDWFSSPNTRSVLFSIKINY